MKQIIATLLMIMYFMITTLALGSIRKTAIYKSQYKMALDAGTDAAVKHIAYCSDQQLETLANGFGKGEEDKRHIEIDRDEVLEWFYRVFYANLQITEESRIARQFKKYIGMKCLITYDQLAIADANDEWVVEKPFVITQHNHAYLLTLSDEVKDLTHNEWTTLEAIGMTEEERETYIATFIMEEIKSFLAQRPEKTGDYKINIALSNASETLMGIKGNNLIVFLEGMPIPSLNWFDPKERFYAFSLGGSELLR